MRSILCYSLVQSDGLLYHGSEKRRDQVGLVTQNAQDDQRHRKKSSFEANEASDEPCAACMVNLFTGVDSSWEGGLGPGGSDWRVSPSRRVGF